MTLPASNAGSLRLSCPQIAGENTRILVLDSCSHALAAECHIVIPLSHVIVPSAV